MRSHRSFNVKTESQYNSFSFYEKRCLKGVKEVTKGIVHWSALGAVSATDESILMLSRFSFSVYLSLQLFHTSLFLTNPCWCATVYNMGNVPMAGILKKSNRM